MPEDSIFANWLNQRSKDCERWINYCRAQGCEAYIGVEFAVLRMVDY